MDLPEITATSETALEFGGSASMITKVEMAIPNLASAVYFSKKLKDLEEKYTIQDFGDIWEEVLANASACVFLSVAALESYVNEFFLANYEYFVEKFPKMFTNDDRSKILEKFDNAAGKTGKEIDKSTQKFGNTLILIDLRNSLMHFKPQYPSSSGNHEKLSRKLKSKFEPSPFVSDQELFPRAWASYGCAAWAVQSVVEFLKYFETLVETSPKISAVRL